MELGSQEHKQTLVNGILKVALKTTLLGLIIGVLLMVPSFIRHNLFSTGLAYAGSAVIFGSLIWSLWVAWRKYQKIIKPFDETFNQRS
ncbi:hypothetical protein QCB45_07535 [Thiomicrorhabdus sp. ZW0627]|uniref:hypothetical protein n=1 Tax=Thiomicrorhabdus sp. ZW0627 TaxID=3039774 RepID=UPI002436F219|nr:hypothetical protein [Thiomicrorhabdus sp. ZW0627]MDG6774180.1 hypothetical protein [Thiomicrorhabdus sp. ZW0627]